jgi:gas vesicle protein
LGQWLTKGAGWLKDKVGDRVQVDFDPKQAGKDLGRRLAEGKSEAEKQAKDLETKAKSKVEEVSKEVKSEVDHFTEEVRKRVNRGNK